MKIIIIPFVLAITFIAFVRYIESKSIYFPTREIPVTPEYVGLPFEDITLTTQDNLKINGWLVRNPQAKATILFFHGNGGNISHRLEKLDMFFNIGLNVFIVDYRGFGKSQGHPSEQGIYTDALAAYDYLANREDIDNGTIIGYGASLGGVVAVELATKRKLACLIVDSSFPSAAEMSKTIYPFIPAFFLATKFDSINKVKTITIPKLFLHSRNDEIVPYQLGRRLFEAACEPKEFLQLTGGHNTSHIDSRRTYLEGIEAFLKKYNLF